jgi:hypothetical protein
MEFVNGAVTLQPLATFADALAANERSLAVVAGFSVYRHDIPFYFNNL